MTHANTQSIAQHATAVLSEGGVMILGMSDFRLLDADRREIGTVGFDTFDLICGQNPERLDSRSALSDDGLGDILFFFKGAGAAAGQISAR